MENHESKASRDEKTILKAIIGGEPQVLFVESGGIKPTEKPNRKHLYETTTYLDEAPSGILGGKAHIVAAAEIAKVFPDVHIVTSARDDINSETHAKVMEDELIRLGVPKERISREEQSINTLTELTEMVKMAVRENWKSVAVLTSDYHIARNLEMFVHLDELADPKDEEFKNAWESFKNNVSCVFIGAETILPLRNIKYGELIAKVEESPAYIRRIEFETRGVEAIREKSYKSNPSVNVLLTPKK
jgi:hypothetical protein